jgi:hypothetical protein
MTTPIIGSRAAGRRLSVTFALFTFTLLCVSCEMKKAALTLQPEAFYAQKTRGGGGGGGAASRNYRAVNALASAVESEVPVPRKIIRNGNRQRRRRIRRKIDTVQ